MLLSVYIFATTISVKYNNAGNIKLEKRNEWKGQTNTDSNDTFSKFSSPELGIRALKIVIQKNIAETNSYEEYVNRYASEEYERKEFRKTGKLNKNLENYARILAEGQNDSNISDKPKDIDMIQWIKSTIVAEGGKESLHYYTDEIIGKGIKEE